MAAKRPQRYTSRDLAYTRSDKSEGATATHLTPQKSLASTTAEHHANQPGGGRTWWAHFEFTRINVEPTILRKKIEDWREVCASMSS